MGTLLIDADGVAFTAAAAAQTSIRWDDDIITTHADLADAQRHFEQQLLSIAEAYSLDADIVLCFSCPSRRYFRHKLLPTYKGNRKSDPPLALRDLKVWASGAFPTYTKPNLEADDVLGILATHPKLIKGEKVIVSADKDLQQIPGLHMDARAPAAGVFRVRPEFADRMLWTQVLMGDAVDNYTGIPGIGAKRAEKILASARPDEPLWQVVLGAYRKAKLTDEDFLTQLNVARILTSSNYDFKRKEPILWTSTTR